MNQPIARVGVVGAGFMGTQIALQCAVFGKSVSLYDIHENALENSKSALSNFLAQMIEEGFLSTDRRLPVLELIRHTTLLEEAAGDAELIIEAVKEDISVKQQVFRQLDRVCPRGTIFGTNSSSIRVSRIESATNRPDRVLNTHFVQPVWKHPFVELMRGSATSDKTWNEVQSFMQSIGVIPILVRKESTGFIFNRIWRAVKKEALKVVDSGVATVEDVDRTWMIQMESSMGPLAMMDTVGLDVVRDIESVYFQESGDPSDAPPQILLDKIANGELGVKTGRGFYDYPNPAWQSKDFLKQGSH